MNVVSGTAWYKEHRPTVHAVLRVAMYATSCVACSTLPPGGISPAGSWLAFAERFLAKSMVMSLLLTSITLPLPFWRDVSITLGVLGLTLRRNEVLCRVWVAEEGFARDVAGMSRQLTLLLSLASGLLPVAGLSSTASAHMLGAPDGLPCESHLAIFQV
jgi:hypothetical protein